MTSRGVAPVWRSAGKVSDGVNVACGASPKPGVPAAVSAGGGAGLPDLPRDARGALDFAGVFLLARAISL